MLSRLSLGLTSPPASGGQCTRQPAPQPSYVAENIFSNLPGSDSLLPIIINNISSPHFSTLQMGKYLLTNNSLIQNLPSFALLYINFSKTIQFGQKDLVIPLIRNNCRALGHIYHLDPFFTKLLLSLVLSHTGTPLDLLLTLLTRCYFKTQKPPIKIWFLTRKVLWS